MTRFVVGYDRSQSTLFPERLDNYLGEDNPVRAIVVFVDVRQFSCPPRFRPSLRLGAAFSAR
jgi:hypothetical protein